MKALFVFAVALIITIHFADCSENELSAESTESNDDELEEQGSKAPAKLLCKGFGLKVIKQGCWNSNHRKTGKRILSKYLLTDRDRKHPRFSGTLINWRHWKRYGRSLMCRCARETMRRNWKFFGLQYYGECWSVKKSRTYKKGGKSNNCIQNYGQRCKEKKKSNFACVGEGWTNYVYKVMRVPL